MPDGRRGGRRREQGSGYLNQDYGDGEARYDLEWVWKMGKWMMVWEVRPGQVRSQEA